MKKKEVIRNPSRNEQKFESFLDSLPPKWKRAELTRDSGGKVKLKTEDGAIQERWKSEEHPIGNDYDKHRGKTGGIKRKDAFDR